MILPEYGESAVLILLTGVFKERYTAGRRKKYAPACDFPLAFTDYIVYNLSCLLKSHAVVAELADAHGSGPCG